VRDDPRVSPWIVYALLASLFAALVAVFGKVGVKNVDPTLATAVRATVMMVFLVTVAAVTGKAGGVGDIDRRSLVFILLSGLAGAASWLFYFVALREGPASGVAALDRTSVALVFVLAVMFLGETFTWKGAIGAALVVAGAILLI
jgi:transporter family protein